MPCSPVTNWMPYGQNAGRLSSDAPQNTSTGLADGSSNCSSPATRRRARSAGVPVLADTPAASRARASRARSSSPAGTRGIGSSVASEEVEHQPVKLAGLLQLRPVPAAAEHVQLRLADLLERDERAVERVHPVFPAPDEQNLVAQPVRLPPEHAI